MIPNRVCVEFNNKKIHDLNLPLSCGFLCMFTFVLSPFLFGNYIMNSSYFDKLYDKYDIDIKRYHQYDGNNNKYAYPSVINIKINKKFIQDNNNIIDKPI